jgi:hypothetical protein
MDPTPNESDLSPGLSDEGHSLSDSDHSDTWEVNRNRNAGHFYRDARKAKRKSYDSDESKDFPFIQKVISVKSGKKKAPLVIEDAAVCLLRKAADKKAVAEAAREMEASAEAARDVEAVGKATRAMEAVVEAAGEVEAVAEAAGAVKAVAEAEI